MSQFIFPPLTASLDSEASSGAALPSAQMIVGGFFSGTSVVYPLAVDAAGQLQVDVLSTTGPSNYATDTLQTAGNVLLTTISTKDFATQTTLATLATQTTLASLEGKDFATQTTLATIDADTSKIAGAVDAGGQMQVDIVADGAGLATEATLGTIDTDTGNIATSTASVATSTASIATNTTGLNNCVDAGGSQMQVDVVAPLPSGTNTIGAVTVASVAPVDFLDSGVVDSSTTNIPTGGSVVLCTNLAAACTEIEVVDDIGEYMSLYADPSTGTGYVLKTYLPLGGGRVKVTLASGDDIKLYSETGTTISSGKIAINFLG